MIAPTTPPSRRRIRRLAVCANARCACGALVDTRTHTSCPTCGGPIYTARR